jgi:hypothetical protein
MYKEGIPSSSGPPTVSYGRHVPTVADDLFANEKPKKKKKRQKGVWYVPWYENIDELSPQQKDKIALDSQEDVLRSLSSPGFIWDPNTKKGKKSREQFTYYMTNLTAAMWKERKMEEDEAFYSSISCKLSNPRQKKEKQHPPKTKNF